MESFLRYNYALFQFFCIFLNNLNFSENSEIWIFFIKIEEFVTKFWLSAYQNVFSCVFLYFWVSWDILWWVTLEKIKIFIFWKKEEDLRLFLVAKSEKTYKKYFLHEPVLGFPNRGPFAEVESTIRPLLLVRLIKSAVAPLLYSFLILYFLSFLIRPPFIRTPFLHILLSSLPLFFIPFIFPFILFLISPIFVVYSLFSSLLCLFHSPFSRPFISACIMSHCYCHYPTIIRWQELDLNHFRYNITGISRLNPLRQHYSNSGSNDILLVVISWAFENCWFILS